MGAKIRLWQIGTQNPLIKTGWGNQKQRMEATAQLKKIGLNAFGNLEKNFALPLKLLNRNKPCQHDTATTPPAPTAVAT